MVLSVCMATFNGGDFVREQVGSILGQLGPSDELVVSDNGSTDGTLPYLRSLGDPRVRLLVYLERRGPVPNFENALRAARGHVIVLADQDDVWLPDRLERVRLAFAGRTGSIFCLVSDGERMDATGRTIAHSNLEVLGFRPGLWRNIVRNSYMGCSMAFSRELLAVALPFPPGIPMHDSWLGILAGRCGTVAVDREPTYRYRVHGENLSLRSRGIVAKVRDRIALVVEIFRRVPVAGRRRGECNADAEFEADGDRVRDSQVPLLEAPGDVGRKTALGERDRSDTGGAVQDDAEGPG